MKTTRKAVLAGSKNVKSAGYCELSALLRNHDPIAYTCGVYGWNFDVFEVYGVTICTGSRSMPGEKLEGVEEYEEKARALWKDKAIPFETRQKEIESLLRELCKLNGGR